MKFYVVKGDLEEYNYCQIGLFTNTTDMLTETTKFIRNGYENVARISNEDHNFSGLVYTIYDDSNIGRAEQDVNKNEIYWNEETQQTYLK